MNDLNRWPRPFVTELKAFFGDSYRLNEPMSAHTTARLGGPADVWLPVNTIDELVQVVTIARRYNVPVFMLGAGANLLVGDGGIRGVVINNRTSRIHFPPDEAESAVVQAESGVNLPGLARRCAQRGLTGLEWAVGVPGTVGGAIANNAGAFGGDISNCLVGAELLSISGERVWQPVNWFEYGYRTSRLKQGRREWIVLQAELQLFRAQIQMIVAQLNAFNERRKSTQPPGATMGSMFKNPPDDYAGRLIDNAGLKGYRIGQVQVSPVHANFFQNLGEATAADMLKLIRLVQATVKEKFGVALELEIEVVGEFESES